MGLNTTVSVYRSGNLIQSGIIAQIDHLADETASYQSGQTPYDPYKIYARWANPDIKHDDKLIDEATGGLTYRVTGQPRQFKNGLCQVRAVAPKIT